MKKNIFSWFGFYLPLPERLKLIREAGFHGVSLWWEDEVWPDLIEKESMPDMVRKNGLIIDNIHTPYKDVNALWAKDETLRKSTVERYMGYLDDCRGYEIPVMVMHCTDENSEGNFYESGMRSFERLISHARKTGIKIAVENTRDARVVDKLLTEFDSPFLGMCYDSSHDWLLDQTKGELLSKWHNRLFTTHLSDNDLQGDRHWIPGDGRVDFKKLAKILHQSGIGSIHLELVSSAVKIEDPAEYLAKAMERITKILEGKQTDQTG